jgi:hypothetical protein
MEVRILAVAAVLVSVAAAVLEEVLAQITLVLREEQAVVSAPWVESEDHMAPEELQVTEAAAEELAVVVEVISKLVAEVVVEFFQELEELEAMHRTQS